MGNTSSNSSRITTNYILTGSNNGLTSGSQSIGTATASATTDVSPKADLNYSTSINPSMFGTLTAIRSLGGKLIGTIGANSDIIQTVKHVASSIYRVAKDEPELIEQAKRLTNSILNKVTTDGVLKSTDQLDFETIKDVADLQVAVVDRMANAHNDYQTVALGTTGIRNSEVSTKITDSALNALYTRATPSERSNKDKILAVAGSRLGIISTTENKPPVDYAMNTFDNASTKYGKLVDVKKQSEDITIKRNSILFSVLHNPASVLASAGVLAPFNIESTNFIGIIKQVSVPFTAISYPNGHQFSSANLRTPGVEVIDTSTNRVATQKFALSAYSYTTPFDDDTREIRLQLSGQVTASRQPYSPTQLISIGFIFKRSGNYYYQRAILINTKVRIEKTKASQQSVGSVVNTRTLRVYNTLENKTNILQDYSKLAISDKLNVYTRKKLEVASDGEKLQDIVNARELKVNSDDPEVARFSYSSQWQCVLNISNTQQINPHELFPDDTNEWDAQDRVNAMLVATYPENVSFAVAVQTPTVQVVTVKMPTEMRFIGNRYHNTVIDALGTVPDWYATSDMHDPWYIYRKVISPLIQYSGRIALIHVSSGAPYNLTKEHISLARKESGLTVLGEYEMRAHVIELITGIGRWMSDAGPVSKYSKHSRKYLFMHICEKVLFQSLTHIDVYAEKVSRLTENYLIDCNEFNNYELLLDQRVNNSELIEYNI